MTTPNRLGQQVMVESMPVVIASDQSPLPITAGATLAVDVTDEPARQLGVVSVTGPVTVSEPVSVDDNGGSLTVDSPQLPAALVGGRLDVNIGAPATLPVSASQLPAALVGGRLDVNIGAPGTLAVDVTDEIARLLGIVVGNQTPGDAFANPTNALAAWALGALWDGTQWLRARGNATSGARVAMERATLVQAGNPAANTALTLTLPAAGAGLFHYITHVYIARIATAALAGGAITEITTTNLNGIRWATGNQHSITVATTNQNVVTDADYTHPLRSAVANTNTTIVMPAPGAAVSWRAWCAYYTGP